LLAYLWEKFTKHFYCICLIIGLRSAILTAVHYHLEPKELWKALSISGLIIGSYLWMRRDLWVTREERKDKQCADQWAACLVAFVWLIIIVPLATVKADPINADLFLSVLFLLLPVSNGIARLLERQKFF
jgi:hypothetical protein